MFEENNKTQNIEEQENLAGFFNLLLQIDKRNNPYLYKKQYARHSDINSPKTQGNKITGK